MVREAADRRVSHGRDDPALSRQLARDADHRRVDSARGTDLADRAGRTRPDHQHHDARRTRACGRHPGRRRDRRDRKHHASSGKGRAAARRDPERFRRNRRADFRIDAIDLYRVRADVPAIRCRALSVRAAGRGRRVRDVRVVLLLAHADPDARDVPDARAVESQRSGARAARTCSPVSRHASSIASKRCAIAIAPCFSVRSRSAGRFLPIYLLLCLGFARADARSRAATSFPLSIPAKSACICAPRPARASRKPRASPIEVEAKIRTVIPKAEQAAVLDNIGVPVSGINLTYDSSDPIGSEDADIMITLKPNHKPTARYVAQLAQRAEHGISRRHIRVPARRHRQPDPQLRPARTDRRADRRQQARGKPRRRRPSARATAQCARPCRCAYPTARRRTDHQRRCRSHEGDAGRPHAARRRAEPADRALRQLADHAELLARSEERRQLSADGRSAAIRHSFAANAREHSGDDESNHRRSRKTCSARSARCRAARSRPSSRTTTCSPCSISSHRRKGATWAAWRPTCTKLVDRCTRAIAARLVDRDSRAGAVDERIVQRSRRRARVRDCARLPADGRELPVVARSVDHHQRPARLAGGHRVDAVRDAHDAERARADRHHPVHRHCDGQQHPRDQHRARVAAKRHDTARGRARSGLRAASVRC